MQSAQFQLHAQIEERHWWFVARRQILRDLVRRIMPESVGGQPVVVDIGCGTGANLAAFADEFRCIGIDTCAEAIELANRRFPQAEFVCGQAPTDVDRWLAIANIVLLTDVLEHVPDDLGLLKTIVNVCAPGALILITVPADMRLWSPHDEAFGHYRRYDAHGLSELWQGLPVRTRLLSHFNSRLYPLVWAARYISRQRGKTAGEANSDFSMPHWPLNQTLKAIFASESRLLSDAIDANRPAFSRGVSLIAVLERISARPMRLEVDSDAMELAASTPDLATYL